MATQAISDIKQRMADRCTAIKEYAERMLIHGDELAQDEKDDQAHLMAEYLAMGRSFGLTESEMVQQALGSIFAMKRECGYHSCASRQFWYPEAHLATSQKFFEEAPVVKDRPVLLRSYPASRC